MKTLKSIAFAVLCCGILSAAVGDPVLPTCRGTAVCVHCPKGLAYWISTGNAVADDPQA